MRLIISAGDPSGDRLGADLLGALRKRGVSFEAAGIGGPRLRAEGLQAAASMESVAVMGFAEILGHLPAIHRARRGIAELLEARADAIFLPIDAPGLNLGLARLARRLGRSVVYYVCPQIWAWGRGRAARVREDVDLTLLLFRFEEATLARERITARWVGHPAGALVSDPGLREAARASLGVASQETLVALLPGSRRAEVRRHLAPMLDGCARFAAHAGGRVLAAVSDAGHVASAMESRDAREAWRLLRPLHWRGDAGDLLRAADLAVVASGTATLETAALGVPQVVVYRTGRVSYEIARRLVRVDMIGLANLVVGKRAAPELIQSEATGPRIAVEIAKLHTDAEARTGQLRAFAGLRDLLGGPGSAERAAEALIEFASARKAR
ncbi:MAG: lipid-A-disaccharide synthase [Candidatus Latescibacteria bacterium]|nr:lipid-A-disaccharide synthase [Candidatus Latescibacterota bacterium]